MFLKYFYDERLAQASYLVGCPAKGTALVIDPARDITPYLITAEKHGYRIVYVTETHIHADFVSGARELAHATGATLLLSAEGDADWQYAYPTSDPIRLLKHGDTFAVGGVRFTALHTPGHTPEHLVFEVTDTDADEPFGIFTGDFLFAGDVGRPDLLEEAAGIMGTREVGARQQFKNVQYFKSLPDYLQIFPGHGAGSACGKALGAVPSTTLGYEKRFNPAFHIAEEDAFVTWLLDGQPEAPRYFGHMKRINKIGAQLLLDLPQAQHIKEQASEEFIPANALFIDTRPASDFAEQHLSGTVNIPISSNSFSTYLGWYVDYHAPLFFIAYPNDVQEVLKALFAIGVDDVPGYFTPEAIPVLTAEKLTQKTPEEVYQAHLPIIDVRALSEYQSEHIAGVKHIHMGAIPKHLQDIPQDTPLVIQCGSGVRSQIVLSLLESKGFTNLINMRGGLDAWKRAKLPLEQN